MDWVERSPLLLILVDATRRVMLVEVVTWLIGTPQYGLSHG